MAFISIQGFDIDASLRETHAFDSEVTEHPVEAGADIADHVRARPIIVQIEGVVSNTPIGELVANRRAGSIPTDDAFKWLMDIRDAREPVSIITALKNYDNMVLESLNVPLDSRTGDALRFTASFKQIVLVTNLRTTLRVATSAKSAQLKVDRGQVAAKFIADGFTSVGVKLSQWDNALAKIKKSSSPSPRATQFDEGPQPTGAGSTRGNLL